MKLSNTQHLKANEETITSDDMYLEGIKNGFEPEIVELFKSVAIDSDVIDRHLNNFKMFEQNPDIPIALANPSEI